MRQLQRFKVDRLKIDRSFIGNLGHSPESAAIVHAIISLGHAMALQVTAEGVETQEQCDFLVGAGVDELQGYFFARATDERTLAEVLCGPRGHAGARVAACCV
jgi:EAL domain-containing protein (putative c-di-GMP-specific phosphodiesterase class I)